MEHALTIELPDEIYTSPAKTAQETVKTPEELAVEWLILASRYALDDPLEEFIGAFHGDVPDWADQHDKYIGQGLMEER